MSALTLPVIYIFKTIEELHAQFSHPTTGEKGLRVYKDTADDM